MGPGGFPGTQAAPRVWVVPLCSLALALELVWDSGCRGEGPGAGSAVASRPGSHHGGAWLGARVWFEISATRPGLPRPWQPAAGKHGEVGRASRAHKEPSVAGGGGEGATRPEVWARPGWWDVAASVWGLRPGPRRVCVPEGTARLPPSGFGSRFHLLSRPGGFASPTGVSVSSSVRWGRGGRHAGVR